MFGYMDESGDPGVANNDNDYLVVSLVVMVRLVYKQKSPYFHHLAYIHLIIVVLIYYKTLMINE